MSARDYHLNAMVRRYLVSRRVDMSRLQLGTTNGVVYIMGVLDSTAEVQIPDKREIEEVDPAKRVLFLAMRLERDLRRMRDVRDVVFKLENATKIRGRWQLEDGTTLA
jgi:hypothetical protein